MQPQKLREANAALKKELETKAEVRQRTQLQDLVTNAPRDNVLEGTKIGYINQALRANSNRQVKQGSVLSQLTSLDEQWNYIQTGLLGMKLGAVVISSINDIIPRVVRYDVKYLNTKLFETALTANNWTSKDYNQY